MNPLLTMTAAIFFCSYGACAQDAWRQQQSNCREQVRAGPGGKECGMRQWSPAPGRLNEEDTSPGEFPWTCLVLNQKNVFLGACAIIPQVGRPNTVKKG